MGPMGKADRMALLAIGTPCGFFLALDWVYNGLLTIVLIGCLFTLVRRAQATYADLQAAA
jgi:hypothetical protein